MPALAQGVCWEGCGETGAVPWWQEDAQHLREAWTAEDQSLVRRLRGDGE